MSGVLLGAAASAGLVLKPAVLPIVSRFGGEAHVLSFTAETHLYFVVPGVALFGVAVLALAIRLVPPSVLGLDGESFGKDLLSAAGIALGSLGAAAVLVLAFLVDRSSLAGLLLRFLPGLALGVLGILAAVLGLFGAFADADRSEPETSPSLAADLSDMGSLLRAVAEAPAEDVRAWLPTENVAASGQRPAEIALPRVGTRLDRFELLAPLGAGGMGRVFRARDTRLLRDVALKLLPSELMHDPVRRERLLREARAAARVSHPNVLAIHEVGDAGGVPYIVMELVAGSTLRDRLEASPIALGEALAIAHEIAQGLAAAHQQGVVHRDLKPENVALAVDGRVKLLDFGLARFDTSPEPYGDTVPGSPHLTRDGQVLGTPAYMSPEQALGEPVDARSDVFSFGTLLFELVTGRCPFARHTSEDTRRAVIDAALPDDGWQERVPAAIAEVISRATERDPLRRFASGAELVAALEAVRYSRGTLAAS
jgi:hypothetical protein